MKPANNKSLIHFLFDQMAKLDEKKISVDEARAMAGIAKQVNVSFKYELERAKLLKEIEGTSVKLREVELFNPEQPI
jgi:hypothetical protein